MIDIALKIAWAHLGTPYIWGGDDSIEGLDCSGFILEIFKSIGFVGRKFDTNANGLMKKYENMKTTQTLPGVLVFWGKNDKATHVEMIVNILDGEILTIGASGGGRNTKTREDAIRDNAYIKVRPIRSDPLMLVDPFYHYRNPPLTFWERLLNKRLS